MAMTPLDPARLADDGFPLVGADVFVDRSRPRVLVVVTRRPSSELEAVSIAWLDCLAARGWKVLATGTPPPGAQVLLMRGPEVGRLTVVAGPSGVRVALALGKRSFDPTPGEPVSAATTRSRG